MFNIKPFNTPPKITYTDKESFKNKVIINVTSNSGDKVVTATAVSSAVAKEIRKANLY